MGKQMDRLMSLTRYQIIRMKEMDEFHLLSDDPQCVNVCFWYVPKRLRGQDLTEEVKIELGKVRKHFNVLFPTRTIFIRKPLANFPKTLIFRLVSPFTFMKALHHSLLIYSRECILICHKSWLLTSLASLRLFYRSLHKMLSHA